MNRGSHRRDILAAVGAGLAALPWLHTRFALLAAALAAIVIARLAGSARLRSAIDRSSARQARCGRAHRTFLAVPAVAALAWFAYFWVIWGTPSPLVPYGADTESSPSYIARGLAGLLIDQQHGVFTTAPIYAIALAGLWPLVRGRRQFATELLVVVVAPYLIAVSAYAMWWGGTSAPARFVVAILPLAALPIAGAWARMPWSRVPALLLLLVSTALVVPRVLVEGGRFIFTTRNGFDATIEWLSRHVDLTLALPSVHRGTTGAAIVDALPWLIVIAIVIAAAPMPPGALRLGRARRMDARWRSSGALVAMGAASMVWLFQGTPAVTPDRSTLAALAGIRPWHAHRCRCAAIRA